MNIGELTAVLGADTTKLKRDLAVGQAAFTSFGTKSTAALSTLKTMVFSVAGAVVALGGAMAAMKLKNHIMEVTRLAGRYDVLGITMYTAGKNAGYSSGKMDDFERSVQGLGIAGIEAREALTRLAVANINLAQSTDLARAAQDLAVVGGINSSEAFNRMIYAIQAGRLVILRTLGLNVSFEEGYKKLADSLGKTTEALSANEKMQSRVNTVLQGAKGYLGIYEQSMKSAEKQLGSLKRYVDEYKRAFGSAFQPAFLEMVLAKTDLYKDLKTTVSDPELQIALMNAGKEFANIYVMTAKWAAELAKVVAINLTTYLEDISGAIQGLRGMYDGWPKILIEKGILGGMLLGKFNPLQLIKIMKMVLQLRGQWNEHWETPEQPFVGPPEGMATLGPKLQQNERDFRGMEMDEYGPMATMAELGLKPFVPPPEEEPLSKEMLADVKKMMDDITNLIDEEAYKSTQVWRNSLVEGLRAADLKTDVVGIMVHDIWDGPNGITQSMEEYNESFLGKMDQGMMAYTKSISDYSQQLADGVGNAFKGMEDMLVKFITTGKFEFKEFVNSIIADFARIAVRRAIMAPLMGLFGMPILGAKGLAFSGGNLTPMAKGGLLTQPTLFPMANGGLALGGEAGTEAIMPLKRTSSGDLGVLSAGGGEESGGSGGDINLYIMAADSKSFIDMVKRNPEAIIGPFVKALKGGDQELRGAIRSTQ